MSDTDWESFIEACARQLMKEGEYIEVIPMGGAGDKGRDVCAYTKPLPEADTWDLYQGKHYESALSPSSFAPELAKFLASVYEGDYSRPRRYLVCAPKVGPKLIDYIKNPESMRTWILAEWQEKKGDFGKYKKQLSPGLELFIKKFPFEIIGRKTSAELLDIHSRSDKHWEQFGVLALRPPNPDVPEAPAEAEQNYVTALLQVYEESHGAPVQEASLIPTKYTKHFSLQRRLFYSAEGLNRFSRDKLPGAFDDLIQQVELGVSTIVEYPHADGMTRLKEVLMVANTLQVGANPLSARLQAGDLQGSCHHLANRGDIIWVQNDD